MSEQTHTDRDPQGRSVGLRRIARAGLVLATVTAVVVAARRRLSLAALPLPPRARRRLLLRARQPRRDRLARALLRQLLRLPRGARPGERTRGAGRDHPVRARGAAARPRAAQSPPPADAARGLLPDRPPHRPLQLRHLRRLPAQRGDQGRPIRGAAHAADDGPRPLQAVQRPARARDGQRPAAARRGDAAGRRARSRHGGPLRRRGVRRAHPRRRGPRLRAGRAAAQGGRDGRRRDPRAASWPARRSPSGSRAIRKPRTRRPS